MKARTIIFTLTAVVATAATAFCIQKELKIRKKLKEEQAELDSEIEKDKDIEEAKELVKEVEERHIAPILPLDAYREPDDEPEEFEPDPEKEEVEEETKMKFDPNSIDAWIAFRENQLRDFELNSPVYISIKTAFDVSWNPKELLDDILLSNLIEARTEFFGPDSKYSQEDTLTLGDVVIFFANKISYDLDQDETRLEFWSGRILDEANILGDSKLKMRDALVDIMEHRRPYGDEAVGLFGLRIGEDTTDTFDESIQFMNQFYSFEERELASDE